MRGRPRGRPLPLYFESYPNYLLDADPAVGLWEGRNRVAADRHGESGRGQRRRQGETSGRRGAVAEVQRACAVQGHAVVGVDRSAGDPAGDGDPLAEADEARSVQLYFVAAVRRPGPGRL